MLNHVILVGVAPAFADVARFTGLQIIEKVNAPHLPYLFFGQFRHRLSPLLSAAALSGIFRHWFGRRS
jgi:hypothetical protein